VALERRAEYRRVAPGADDRGPRQWDGTNIVTEWAAGRLKLTRTYASSTDGKALTVIVTPKTGTGNTNRTALAVDDAGLRQD